MERVYEWDRLNNDQIARLNRLQTILLLPLGNSQQHGPHLPQGTISFVVERVAQETASLLTVTDRERTVVILPRLAYGADPVELHYTERYKGPASLSLRAGVLEALVTDIAEGAVRNGFRYLFTIGYHAGPAHCRAVQRALEAVSRSYPALIAADIFSYLAAGAAANAAPDLRTLANRRVTPVEQAALETPSHAGTASTAIMLALDPNLVARDYTSLEGIPADSAATMAQWPGYYGGAPAIAEADLGLAVITQMAYRATYLIRKAAAGESLADLPRYPE